MPRSLDTTPRTTVPLAMPDAAVEARLRIDLLDVAARTGRFAGWVTVCIVAFLYVLLRSVDRAAPLTGWLVLMVLWSVARILLCESWRNVRTGAVTGSDADRRVAGRWESYHAGLAFAGGLAWAALVFAIQPELERSTLLAGFGLTIALMLASTSYASNAMAHLLFGVPIVFAQLVNLQRLAAEYNVALSAAWLVLVGVFHLMPRMASIPLRQALRERIVHDAQVATQPAWIEAAPLGMLVLHGETIVVCSDALVRMLGYARRDDLIGRSVRLLMPDDDAWDRARADAMAARHGPVSPRIARLRRSDAGVIEVLCNLSTMHAATGDGALVVVFEDVQERLATEENFRHALRMQRLVFESAGEGIAIVDDGVIEQANQALSDLVGVPVIQLTGRRLQSIFEDPNGWSEIERRFQRLGNTLKLERRLVRSDGRAVWVNVTGCLVDAPVDRDGAGDPTAGGERSIWILADLTVQKQKEAENWHHANHDVMTGLPNRRFLQDRLDQALAFARRDGRRVAVIELDLDGFKSVNDTYGHRFGDAVLEEVARRLSTVVRELDTVGRWGGDEFVLVLKEIESREIVEETVKRVIARLSESIVYQGHDLSIGASIGIALFPDHGEEVEALMLAADLAMYESKSSGGNTWRFASPSVFAPRGKYRPASVQVPVDG